MQKSNFKKDEVLVKIRNLHKYFYTGKRTIYALRGVDLDIYEKDFVVIFGPSGCGKSTLLNLILGIDKPTKGRVEIKGVNIFKLSEDERATFRAQRIGTIYQMSYWVKSLTALENVALPLVIKGIKSYFALRRAEDIMEKMGIGDLKNQIPTQLSGGEQQKVGLARAIVVNPLIIIADEPTGNLDSKAGREVMKILEYLNKEEERTIILVTHNEEYWDYGKRRVEMKDGKIIKEENHGYRISA